MSTFDLAAGGDPDLVSRPRRNRRTAAIRSMCRETKLEVSQLIYPMFLHADANDVPIASMPGQTRWSLDGLVAEVKRVYDLGVDKVVIFPKVDESLKTRTGDEAYNPDGLIPESKLHRPKPAW
jgi:porphobilinogen synthase